MENENRKSKLIEGLEQHFAGMTEEEIQKEWQEITGITPEHVKEPYLPMDLCRKLVEQCGMQPVVNLWYCDDGGMVDATLLGMLPQQTPVPAITVTQAQEFCRRHGYEVYTVPTIPNDKRDRLCYLAKIDYIVREHDYVKPIHVHGEVGDSYVDAMAAAFGWFIEEKLYINIKDELFTKDIIQDQ